METSAPKISNGAPSFHARSLTEDHKLPKSRGGKNTLDNKVPACRRCNDLKGAWTEEEFRKIYPTPEAIKAARRPLK